MYCVGFRVGLIMTERSDFGQQPSYNVSVQHIIATAMAGAAPSQLDKSISHMLSSTTNRFVRIETENWTLDQQNTLCLSTGRHIPPLQPDRSIFWFQRAPVLRTSAPLSIHHLPLSPPWPEVLHTHTHTHTKQTQTRCRFLDITVPRFLNGMIDGKFGSSFDPSAFLDSCKAWKCYTHKTKLRNTCHLCTLSQNKPPAHTIQPESNSGRVGRVKEYSRFNAVHYNQQFKM